MKILTAEQVRQWDQYTISNEPVTSLHLMERAALRCTEWLLEMYREPAGFTVFCGKGNNGGDGLAIARQLSEQGFPVTVYILEFGFLGTPDFQANLARLHALSHPDIHFVQSEEQFHPVPEGQIVIDALFGTGLNRELESVTAALVQHINRSGRDIISIDIPSGLFTDRSSSGAVTIKASHTLSFQCYKPAFLFAENEDAVGELHLLDIGLHQDYYQALEPKYELTDHRLLQSFYRPRKQFSHKGTHGHALLLAGSHGKMGAAVLAARACLRSGAGLLTCHIPDCGYTILQTAVPEAMVTTDAHPHYLTHYPDGITRFKAIAAGPGLGQAPETAGLLRRLLAGTAPPLVLDADALNALAASPDLLKMLPSGTILTPHTREFDRLFGVSANDFDRLEKALEKAEELNCIVVLKGKHTLIATADGKAFFNGTGNPGMATAGSGDVLTGVLLALLAQGYSPSRAALLGVYLHGLAGDLAATSSSMESLLAGDIINHLGSAFRMFYPE